jgi:hypothetical protein
MSRTLRGLSVGVFVAGLGLVGTPAQAVSTPTTTPDQVRIAATALGVTGTPRTTQIDDGDDGSDVRSALNSAAGKASSANPQFVYFPASKTYDFGSSAVGVGANVYVVLADGVTITKQGSATAALSFGGSPSGAYGGTWLPASGAKDGRNLFRVGVPGVTFAKLTLRGANNYGVSATAGANVTLNDVTVTASKRHGIGVDNATITLNHSYVTDNDVNGIAMNNSSTAIIDKSDISRNGLAPETSSSGDAIGDGISINKGSTATIANSFLNSNGVNGASINGKSTLNFRSGAISYNKRHGIGTRADSYGAPTINFNNSEVEDTAIRSNKYNGILAVGGTSATLKHVQITNTKAWGLSVDKSSVSLDNTIIDHSGLNNVSIRHGSKLTFYNSNQISYAQGGTYNVPGPEGDKTEKGHGVAASGASKLYIKGTLNKFYGNAYYGILVSERDTYGKAYATAQSVQFTPNNVKGPGKVQNYALFRLEPGFSTSEFPTFKVDTGGKFDRQQ